MNKDLQLNPSDLAIVFRLRLLFGHRFSMRTSRRRDDRLLILSDTFHVRWTRWTWSHHWSGMRGWHPTRMWLGRGLGGEVGSFGIPCMPLGIALGSSTGLVSAGMLLLLIVRSIGGAFHLRSRRKDRLMR